MLDLLKARLRQGRRTTKFPREQVMLPARFRGRPVLDESKCREGCRACTDACPTQAITTNPLRIDLGACLFCPVCEEACPEGAIVYTPDHRLAARSRDRKSTRLNSSHEWISYAVFCLTKKKTRSVCISSSYKKKTE